MQVWALLRTVATSNAEYRLAMVHTHSPRAGSVSAAGGAPGSLSLHHRAPSVRHILLQPTGPLSRRSNSRASDLGAAAFSDDESDGGPESRASYAESDTSEVSPRRSLTFFTGAGLGSATHRRRSCHPLSTHATVILSDDGAGGDSDTGEEGEGEGEEGAVVDGAGSGGVGGTEVDGGPSGGRGSAGAEGSEAASEGRSSYAYAPCGSWPAYVRVCICSPCSALCVVYCVSVL